MRTRIKDAITARRYFEMNSQQHYTFVAPERRNELTRRIRQKLVAAAKQKEAEQPAEVPSAQNR